jgi:hypothetical protein
MTKMSETLATDLGVTAVYDIEVEIESGNRQTDTRRSLIGSSVRHNMCLRPSWPLLCNFRN